MTKGIFFIAFGKRGYMYSAYNFAVSIKHHNPEIKIAIFCDENLSYHLANRVDVFDEIISIPESVMWRDGFKMPGRIKTSVYDFLPFDYNLILDVDGIALKDIEPIFDELIDAGGYYYAPLLGTHKIEQGRDIPPMMWAYADDIWDKYGLDEDTVLPCVNSSFQFVKKCDQAKDLFTQINKNFDDPIPLSKLKTQWGGSQPDELYIDIALAQKGVDPQLPRRYLFMANTLTHKSYTDIKADHYILSMFGNKNMIRARYKEFYDIELIEIFRRMGMNHIFKFHFIGNDKHANTRPKQSYSNETKFHESIIPIRETKEINHYALLKEYPLPNGLKMKATNWFNCSWIKYRDKIYFAYRIEGKPFCKTIRIGLCLLDDNMEPIEGSNVLLNLHAALPGYPKGYHTEDPRLFIFKDELYLSYTDGYQMAQAKIDPETLQATESFYIDKPLRDTTEKNWTFFEYQDELYSVYNTCPHRIFKMDGPHWKEVYKTRWDHEWNYGQIRGGTSPVRVGDYFISFFHSSKDIKYKGLDGKQYFMGAYTFEAKPPFKPISVTTKPLIAGEAIDDNIARLSNKIFVVFPSGVIRKEDSWLVSFGYNDYRCRYVEISDELLEKELVPVKYKELTEA